MWVGGLAGLVVRRGGGGCDWAAGPTLFPGCSRGASSGSWRWPSAAPRLRLGRLELPASPAATCGDGSTCRVGPFSLVPLPRPRSVAAGFFSLFFALCPSASLFLFFAYSPFLCLSLCFSLSICFGPCCSRASCCCPRRPARQGSSAAPLQRCCAAEVRCCSVFVLFSSPRSHLLTTCAVGSRRATHSGPGSRDTARVAGHGW